MLDVCEALAEVLRGTPVGPTERVELSEAAGRVLREPIIAPSDVPPFTKALMDGFAVRSEDLRSLPVRLSVVDEIPAGATPRVPLIAGACAKIMTGAPLPEGADAVVRVEDTAACGPDDQVGAAGSGFEVAVGRHVVVLASAGPVRPGRNALSRGEIMRRGASILTEGRRLRAQEIAVLGESGFASVTVSRRPSVAILSTGDELVPVAAECGPGQIRNSNEAMLAAQVREVGGRPVPLGIVGDDRGMLSARVAEALQHDFLLLSGGVSAGERDFVPGVLAERGVRRVFHGVRLKPGKPLWFGVASPHAGRAASAEVDAPDHAGGRPAEARGTADGVSQVAESEPDAPVPRLVFGLPGNPVSSMVCCELFVKPALRRWMGLRNVGPASVLAALSQEFVTRGDRPTYHPARLAWIAETDLWQVTPVRWLGSADLLGPTRANAVLVLPPGPRRIPAGTRLEVLPLGTEWWEDATGRHCAGRLAPSDPPEAT